MDYSKLSDQDLKALYDNDYSKLSDETLKQLNAETSQEVEPVIPQDVEQEPIKAGVSMDYTPSGLIGKAGTGLASLAYAPISGQSIPEAYQQLSQLEDPRSSAQKFITDLAVYNTLGKLTGLNKQPLVEGAIIGGLEGSKEGNDPLSSAIGGGVTSVGLSTGIPLARLGASKLAGAYLESGIPATLADIFANVRKPLTETAIKNPWILKPLEEAKEFGSDVAYSNIWESLGKDVFESLMEKGNALREMATKASLGLQNLSPKTNIKQDIIDIFKKYSDKNISAIKESPQVTKNIEKYIGKEEPSLYSLHTLMKNLNNLNTQNLVKDTTLKTTSSDIEQKVARDIATKIDEYLKQNNKEYTSAMLKSKAFQDFIAKSGVSEKNIVDILKKYKEGETGPVLDISKELPSDFDLINDINRIQAGEAFTKLTPQASGTMQILTRKALPYVGMGALGSALGPMGFLAGIGASGLVTSPKVHGKLLSQISKIAKRPQVNQKTIDILKIIGAKDVGRNTEKGNK